MLCTLSVSSNSAELRSMQDKRASGRRRSRAHRHCSSALVSARFFSLFCCCTLSGAGFLLPSRTPPFTHPAAFQSVDDARRRRVLTPFAAAGFACPLRPHPDMIPGFLRAGTPAACARWVCAFCAPTVFFGFVTESFATLTAPFVSASFTRPLRHHLDMIAGFLRAISTAAAAGWVLASCAPTTFFGFVAENCAALAARFVAADLTHPHG